MDRRVWIPAVWVYAAMSVGGLLRAAEPFLRIPEADREILSKVAAEYRLTYEQRRLLFAIRLAENGGPGVEMGVMTPQAQRYRGDHARSLRLQAQWAAGTIKRRWTGDLDAFARRWAPVSVENDPRGLNRYWRSNVAALFLR